MYNVTITFNVNGQIISRNEKDITLLSDSIDLIEARFNFSPEWQGYTKTAIFKNSTKRPYSRILVDDACMVPPEAIRKSKYMSVSVFGVSGTQLITATDQIVPLTPSGYTDDSIVSPAPTENIYQQMVTIMETQAVDATRAETAQGEAEQAERTAKSHAEQTARDAQEVADDKQAVVDLKDDVVEIKDGIVTDEQNRQTAEQARVARDLKWSSIDVEVETLNPDDEATAELVQTENSSKFEFGIPKGEKGDTGAQGPIGNVMYATFDIDFDMGELVMTIPDGYTGPTFSINDETGELEVSI